MIYQVATALNDNIQQTTDKDDVLLSEISFAPFVLFLAEQTFK